MLSTFKAYTKNILLGRNLSRALEGPGPSDSAATSFHLSAVLPPATDYNYDGASVER